MSDNNSTRKLAIEKIAKPDGSSWIDVVLLKYGPPHPRFRPSFLDLHRIIQAIADCEDARYPPPRFAGRGRLAAFLRDAVLCRDFATLARKYNIPERDGDAIVRTNGAAVSGPPDDSNAAIDAWIVAQDAARTRK